MSKRKLNQDLVSEKIGYDYANKKMMIRVYDSLLYIMNHSTQKPTWVAIVKHMLALDGMLGGDLCEVSINGYYSTIRKNLGFLVMKIGPGLLLTPILVDME